jgi:hypothetical protein
VRKGILEATDGIDLAIAESLRVERGETLKTAPERIGVLQPRMKSLGLVEGEDPPRPGMRVASVPEEGFVTG